MIYKINEIFYSIQGEGLHAGTPVVFIRMAGCNMACDFCDTDHSIKEQYDEREILEILLINYPVKAVVITGGEPLLQDLEPLVNMLREAGYFICLETNGTIHTDLPFDWVTISPKGNTKLFKGNELKVVYQGQPVDTYTKKFQVSYLFLQPVDINGQMNIQETIKVIKADPRWRLSVQLHKLIGVR